MVLKQLALQNKHATFFLPEAPVLHPKDTPFVRELVSSYPAFKQQRALWAGSFQPVSPACIALATLLHNAMSLVSRYKNFSDNDCDPTPSILANEKAQKQALSPQEKMVAPKKAAPSKRR